MDFIAVSSKLRSARRVVLTWVAVNNDPFEREGRGGPYKCVNGNYIEGPTLSLLFDARSPYRGSVGDIVLFHGSSPDGREREALKDTEVELKKRDPDLHIHTYKWDGVDPIDHAAIFAFLKAKVPELRRKFSERELIIHISPGTAAMHTIWLLMAETGFIDQPFTVVQTYRKGEGPSEFIKQVKVGLETFFQKYKLARPRQTASEEQALTWDYRNFQTQKMRSLYKEAERFAQLNIPVLILGERGTGKTNLAGWIRQCSPFKKKEMDNFWPSIACGQYSPETMRSELFGYAQGAFTGADASKEGLLTAADGDTLFLDEIGDISGDVQRLLIRAIEEKKYLPLGANKPIKSNFRLLAATNVDPAELRRRLNLDFLDRIGILTLRLPPLREIREEIVWLWPAVLGKAAARAGVSADSISLTEADHKRIVEHLAKHPLPGNLRDLFTVAYRFLVATSHPHDPLPLPEAIEYGLAGLAVEERREGAPAETVARRVARAFADGKALGDVLTDGAQLLTVGVFVDFKAYLADEIRSAKKGDRPISCDVTERTLREWRDRK